MPSPAALPIERRAMPPYNAPSPAVDPATMPLLRTVGSNQVGMREFNERVVLQAIRTHGSLPKAEVARLTKLSTQTASVIINRLLDEQLVVKRDAVRGKVGQPSQPIALNPEGAFSIGIQIGRRALDVVLLDFTGALRWQSSTPYASPDVEQVFAAIDARLREVDDFLGPELAPRLTGIGLAAPLTLGTWHGLESLLPHQAEAWRRVDVRVRLQAMTPLRVDFAKDTIAACVAELVAGRGRTLKSYLYVFVDTLVGGGLVIDGEPHSGQFGNAGAIGSMPLGLAGTDERGVAPQLLGAASLVRLEEMHAQAGLAPLAFNDDRLLSGPWEAVTLRWIEEAANAITFGVTGAACLLDLDGVIVDGAVSRPLLERLIAAMQEQMTRYSWQGTERPLVMAGTIGMTAKVIGAAYLPLHANFAPAHGLFLKAERR